MAQQTIDVGSSANDGTGDALRDAGQKINQNFTELYNEAPFQYVENYGAVGDNSTDDSTAIQDAVDAGGILAFHPNKKYFINSTITIDPSVCRGIYGNQAYIRFADGIEGIRIDGGKTSSGADPDNSDNQSMIDSEMMFPIDKLHLFNGNYSGTALVLKDTFGVHLSHCHIFQVNDAIEFIDINRNPIFGLNNIYDIAGYAIHFNGGNLHQAIFGLNHISYFDRAFIGDNNPNLADLQILGNQIEGKNVSSSNPSTHIEFLEGSGNIRVIQLVGNGIQDHSDNSGALIRAVGINNLDIKNNQIMQSDSDGVYLESCNKCSISDNKFNGLNGYALTFGAGTFSNIKLVDNELDEISGSATGLFKCDSGTGTVNLLKISGNQGYDLRRRPLIFNANRTLVFGRIHHNIFNLDPGGSFSGSDPYVDINMGGTNLHGIYFVGNHMRARTGVENAFRVTGSNYESIIIKNNSVNGPVTGTRHDYPSTSSEVVVADNIGS